MIAMKVTLNEAQDRFVREQVESGAYADEEAVLIAAIDRLREDVEDSPLPGTPEEEAQKEARFERLI